MLPTRGRCKVHIYRNYLDRIAYAHLDSASDILEVQSLFLDFLKFFYENEIEQPKCNAGTVLLDYMRKNYQSHITLKTLSEVVNFSEDCVQYGAFKVEEPVKKHVTVRKLHDFSLFLQFYNEGMNVRITISQWRCL